MEKKKEEDLILGNGLDKQNNFFLINKYLLFLVVMVILYSVFLLPKLFNLLTFERTEGRVIGYYEEWVRSRKGGGYTKYYPIVEFETKEYLVKFAAPSIMYEAAKEKNLHKVMYNKNNLQEAYVVSFLGLWGPSFTYLLPISLIWSACIFGVGFIPKIIRIKKPF